MSELPFELVDKEVWVTTTPHAVPAPVTDEMVEAGLHHYSEGGCSGLSDHERREVVRDILEAALATTEGQP